MDVGRSRYPAAVNIGVSAAVNIGVSAAVNIGVSAAVNIGGETPHPRRHDVHSLGFRLIFVQWCVCMFLVKQDSIFCISTEYLL